MDADAGQFAPARPPCSERLQKRGATYTNYSAVAAEQEPEVEPEEDIDQSLSGQEPCQAVCRCCAEGNLSSRC